MLTACAPGVARRQHRQRVRRRRRPPARIGARRLSGSGPGPAAARSSSPDRKPARVDLDPAEAGDGGEQLRPARPARRTSVGVDLHPRGVAARGRAPAGSRTGSPASASAARSAGLRRLHPGQPLGATRARRRRSGWPGRRRPACRPAAAPTGGRRRGRRPWSCPARASGAQAPRSAAARMPGRKPARRSSALVPVTTSAMPSRAASGVRTSTSSDLQKAHRSPALAR